MKALTLIFNVIFITLMLAVAFLFVVPLLPIEHNLQMRIVESGSMEPHIMTGSLVVIKPGANYQIGQVITFNGTFADVPTTHRINDVYQEGGRTWFITKGDANEEADTKAIQEKDIIGKVFFTVPYAGYILDFARQPVGFVLLIVLPAIMIVLGEFEKIWFEVRRRREAGVVATEVEDDTFGPPSVGVRAAEKAIRMMDIKTPVRYRVLPPTLHVLPLQMIDMRAQTLVRTNRTTEWATAAMVIFASSIFASVSFLPTTVSYFNDSEFSTENILKAVALDFTALADGVSFAFDDGELAGDGDGAVVTTIELEPGSVDGRFKVAVEATGGSNPLLCNLIQASTAVPFVYSGALTALQGTDLTFSAPFELGLTLPDATGLTIGDTCSVDVVYTAWHFDEEADQGYFDEERTPFSFIYVAGVEQQVKLLDAPLQLIAPQETPVVEQPPVEEPVVVEEEIIEPPVEPLPVVEDPEPVPEPEPEVETPVPEEIPSETEPV